MNGPDVIEVTITVKVTVDRRAWAEEYGESDAVSAVRASVKSYIGNNAGGYPAEAGIFTDVSWK